jgi:hypothetical protein
MMDTKDVFKRIIECNLILILGAVCFLVSMLALEFTVQLVYEHGVNIKSALYLIINALFLVFSYVFGVKFPSEEKKFLEKLYFFS